MTGRPTSFTPELGDLICKRIAAGESLRKVCKEEEFPVTSTVMLWVLKGARGEEPYVGFSEQYATCLDMRTDYMAEEILDISDDDSLDIGFNDDGKPFVKGENIQRARLRVDTRKWIMARMAPKKYGDKVTQEMTGPNGGPIKTITGLATLTPEEAYRRLLDDN